MTTTAGGSDGLQPDELHVVHARAAGLDVHKLQITATVRLCQPGGGITCATRQFSALPGGLSALTQWLVSHRVTAAAMEATGIYWQAPWEALEAAGIAPQLLHAQFVKQVQGRKSDVADSLWLARICQFGLCRPSYVPPRAFRQLRQLSRYRRKLVGERSRARNRIHKTLDHDGLRLGGALTDIFGHNGRKILAGLAPGRSQAALSGHVRHQRDLLEQVLEAQLDSHAVWKLRDLLRAHDAANASIVELDARLEQGLADMAEQVRLLETVPGIDRGSACAILVELGPDLSAFEHTANVAAWAGQQRKCRQAALRPAAPRATLAECAHGAVRTKGSQFHGHHNALKARMPYKRAIPGDGAQAAAHHPGDVARPPALHRSGHRLRQTAGGPQRRPLAAQARRARLSRQHPFRQPAGARLSPIPSLAHRQRWRGTATDTDRGYRGGLPIRRLVGIRRLTAELPDRGVGERCASTTTVFLSNLLSTFDAIEPKLSQGGPLPGRGSSAE